MPVKKKTRRKYWKGRRRPKIGFACSCYWCLRKLERKRARKMSHIKNS